MFATDAKASLNIVLGNMSQSRSSDATQSSQSELELAFVVKAGFQVESSGNLRVDECRSQFG